VFLLIRHEKGCGHKNHHRDRDREYMRDTTATLHGFREQLHQQRTRGRSKGYQEFAHPARILCLYR